MTELQPAEDEARTVASNRRPRWDAIGVVIASLVGLLALLVSGYTAYIQRQQVRAQVWPSLTRAYVNPRSTEDKPYSLTIFNKGVGPAIMHSVQVLVDGKSRATWEQVFDALGLPSATIEYTTLDGNVLSPGETLPALVFHDGPELSRFRQAMSTRGVMRICYCSTLDECWMLADHKLPRGLDVQPVAECPRLSAADTFRD
jgi:hypothetical protein